MAGFLWPGEGQLGVAQRDQLLKLNLSRLSLRSEAEALAGDLAEALQLVAVTFC